MVAEPSKSARDPGSYVHLTPAVIALITHPERDVRWRCAVALRSLPLDSAPHLDALHALMLDFDPGTRMQAVKALHDRRARRKLDEASRPVLQKVIEKDGNSAAAHYARELLEQ